MTYRFTVRRYATAMAPFLSVHSSVTSRCSIKPTKHITQTMRYDSSWNLVF